MYLKEKVVDIRTIFRHEAHDFTVWLEDHINVLSDCINLPLTIEQREMKVGDGLRADLVCRDGQGRRIIVENQLQKADPDHFGRLLMYMGTLKAHGAVWIAPEFHPDIFEAIKHLNDQTKKAYVYYLVKIEAIRTGRSHPVPVFTLHYPSIIINTPTSTRPSKPVAKNAGLPPVWRIYPARDEKICDLLLGSDIISLGFGDWRDLGNIPSNLEDFKAAWARHHPDMSDAQLRAFYTAAYSFVCQAKVGDLVIYTPTLFEQEMYVGEIAGDYEYKKWQSSGRKGRRPAEWIATFSSNGFTPQARKGIRGNRAFFQVQNTQFLTELEALLKRKR